MKSTIKILLYSLCLLAVFSCRKEQTFTVKVFNPVTGEGYEGFEIQIVEGTSTVPCFGCPSESNVIFFGITNADGEVLVTERFHKDYTYSVYFINTKGVKFCYDEAYHEGYNTGGMKINLRMSKIEGSTAYLELVPCAELKLKINNVNCQNMEDSIAVYRELLSLDDYETWSATNPYSQIGCTQTISPSFFKVLMGEYHFWWEVTKNGITNTFQDTIYLEAGEQRIYEINY